MSDSRILFRDVQIVDGTGGPAYRGNVVVSEGVIAEIRGGSGRSEDEIIDGEGLTLSPGFIDVHSHLDFTVEDNPHCANLAAQGITLAVAGNCGYSAGPIGEEMAEYQETRGRTASVGSLGDWFARISRSGIGINVASYVGQGNLRGDVMGVGALGPPDPSQLAKMRTLLADALREGAFGLSTGRDYVPGCYSEPEEITRVAAELGNHPGSFYVSHLLDESAGLVEATEEALEIGKAAGVPTLLSHHKAVVPSNRGLTKESLALVDSAVEAGLDVRLDAYPYDFSATIHLLDMLPTRLTNPGEEDVMRTLRDEELFAPVARDLHEGYPGWTSALADFEWGYTILQSPGFPEMAGLTVGEIATKWNVDPAEAVRQLVLADGGTAVCSLTMSEEDVSRVLAHPLTAVCTDSAAMDTPRGNFRSSVHPRSYGTYPRFFARYVREEKLLSLEEGVRRCSGLPASWLGLDDRGVIKPGARADLVLFDPEGISDTATLENPTGAPRGIRMVMIDGRIAVMDGRNTGILAGSVIKRSDSAR